MLLDNKMNPFGRRQETGAATSPHEAIAPTGILNIEAPTAPVMQDDPSMVEQGIGMAKDVALLHLIVLANHSKISFPSSCRE